MKAANVDMEKVDISLPFIHGVDSRFTTSKRIMLMSKEAQSLSLAELAWKFAMEERDAEGSTPKPKDKQEVQGTALKLKKVLKLISANASDEEMDDKELVLMSSMANKFIKKKNDNSRSRNKDRSSTKKRDPSSVTCYNCNNKGLYAKECPQPKKKEQDPAAKEEKKVFFTGAWSESDSDVDDKGDPDCLMARSDSNNEEIKVTDLKPKLLKRPDLIALANHLIDENATCTRHLEDL